MNQKIKLILGTMQFGERVFGDDILQIITIFNNYGYSEIDTAYVYNSGLSEELIGKSFNTIDRSLFKIATKVNPRVTGKLDGEAVTKQLNESLERMGIDYVDILYLHFPDKNTPIEECLKVCNEYYKDGKILELGLSNFPSWLISEAYNICKKNNWILPTVYEGLYNVLSRKVENELIDAILYYGLRFYAYNPLAGGMLTDKYLDKTIKEGRFSNRPNYQKRYWHNSYFEAVMLINKTAKKYNCTIAEIAYRWLAFHSTLKVDRGDSIIIGASSKSQLINNLESINNGPLENEILNVLDEAWNLCKNDAPDYYKFYIDENHLGG